MIHDQHRYQQDFSVIEGWSPCGEGTYGKVYKAYDKSRQQTVAIKVVSNVAKEDGIPVEVKYLDKLKGSPNIVQLVNYFYRPPTELCIVMEFVDDDLWKIMSTPSKITLLSFGKIKSYTRQLLDAVFQCHSKGVMHRDIKPANLLIDGKGKLKLSDFGLSTSFQDQSEGILSNNVVSLYYRPPELLLGSFNYGPEIDIWSVGCVLMELIKGQYLFAGDDEAKQLEQIFTIFGTPSEVEWPGVTLLPCWNTLVPSMRQHRRPTTLDEHFYDLNLHLPLLLDLASRMLQLDPKKRITAYDALRHPFFTTPNTELDDFIDNLIPSQPNFINNILYYKNHQYNIARQQQQQHYNNQKHQQQNHLLVYQQLQQQQQQSNNGNQYHIIETASRRQPPPPHHYQQQYYYQPQPPPPSQQAVPSRFSAITTTTLPSTMPTASNQLSAHSTPNHIYYYNTTATTAAATTATTSNTATLNQSDRQQGYSNNNPTTTSYISQVQQQHQSVHNNNNNFQQKYLLDINPYSDSLIGERHFNRKQNNNNHNNNINNNNSDHSFSNYHYEFSFLVSQPLQQQQQQQRTNINQQSMYLNNQQSSTTSPPQQSLVYTQLQPPPFIPFVYQQQQQEQFELQRQQQHQQQHNHSHHDYFENSDDDDNDGDVYRYGGEYEEDEEVDESIDEMDENGETSIWIGQSDLDHYRSHEVICEPSPPTSTHNQYWSTPQQHSYNHHHHHHHHGIQHHANNINHQHHQQQQQTHHLPPYNNYHYNQQYTNNNNNNCSTTRFYGVGNHSQSHVFLEGSGGGGGVGASYLPQGHSQNPIIIR